MKIRQLLALITLVAASLPLLTTPVAADDGGLSSARSATAGAHDVVPTGFGLLRDQAGIACIDKAGVGAMGIHYVNGSRVSDAHEDAASPEALIYEPQSNGRLRLVAVEYVVLQSTWHDAGNTAPPSLFGTTFEAVAAGNRYGLPPFYELHAWIWRNNPDGMFKDYNPKVSCAHA